MSVTFIQEHFTKIDFRQHFQPIEGDEPMRAGPGERHWFLDSIYGRDVLKTALRVKNPGLVVPMYKHAPELDERLLAMLDELGLAHLPEPKGLKDHARYLRFALMMNAALETGTDLPAVPQLQ